MIDFTNFLKMIDIKKLPLGTIGTISAMAACVTVKNAIEARTDEEIGHRQGVYEKYVKRPLDFFLASCATVALSPVIAGTAVAVKMNIGSPVIFSQDRPGIIDPETGEERIFKLHKFRTMTDEKGADGELLPDSDRLTHFGEWLRSTSLDEISELLNIIKGDMAIVGPRPLLVRYLDRYNEHQRRRHEARPGLTGLAQVHGRNALGWEEKFDWDVKYVDNITLLGDAKIVLGTIKAVLARDGISAAGDATMPEFMGAEDNRTI